MPIKPNINHSRSNPCRLPIHSKLFQILVYRINRCVYLLHPTLQILRRRIRHRSPQKTLQKLPHQLPTHCGNHTRPVLHLHQDALKILTHADAPQLHQKVPDLKPGPFRLCLRLLLGNVEVGHLHH